MERGLVDERPKRIILCGSMSFYHDMSAIAAELARQDVPARVPDVSEIDAYAMASASYELAKRKASMRHIRKVRDQLTFGILVVNLDKHGVPDYIGPNTFAEIAIALAHYKRIYLYQGIPEFYRDEMKAWQVIPLHGRLDRLVLDYRHNEMVESLQLSLF